ncbi:MAG: hypothetical protein BWY83_03185 [bacterium ADurb.Bin478]|nr:MAG: hypothetical protein BWY83_03185 [bacterium ADurb.Bin478]
MIEIDQRIKKSDEFVKGGVGLNKIVQPADHIADVALHGDAVAQAGLQAGHQQTGGDAFAGDISHCHGDSAVLQRNPIEIISADLIGGDVDALDFDSLGVGILCRQQPLLDIARDVQLLFHALFLQHLLEQIGVLQRDHRLIGQRGEKLDFVVPVRLAGHLFAEQQKALLLVLRLHRGDDTDFFFLQQAQAAQAGQLLDAGRLFDVGQIF